MNMKKNTLINWIEEKYSIHKLNLKINKKNSNQNYLPKFDDKKFSFGNFYQVSLSDSIDLYQVASVWF